jgi:hypothetical protein
MQKLFSVELDEWMAIAHLEKVKFKVLTAAGMKMAVLWVVAPCSLVEIY